MWSGGGWVFASATGEPLNPNTDHHDWKAKLERAKVRETRLHDARHTAATMLLALESPSGPLWESWGGPPQRWQPATST
jgi:integrase